MLPFVTVLKSLSKVRAPGPMPTFTAVDILHALLTISEGCLGRGSLSRKLGLGEGAIRSLLKRLKEEGFVAVTRRGCSLTERGRELVASIREVMPELRYVGVSALAVGGVGFAALVKGAASKVGSGLEQRDAALREGAYGATVVMCVGGKLIIPGCPPELLTAPPLSEEVRRLRELFNPESGDVIVVGSGKDERAAARGALAAALTLVG